MARQPEQGQTKKLTGAAEHWASGGKASTKDLEDDAAAFGVIIEEQGEDTGFQVWPENWDSVVMFLRMTTQWRVSMNGPIGLDYGVLEWLLRLYEVKDQRALLEDLQIMEGAALAAMNKEG